VSLLTLPPQALSNILDAMPRSEVRRNSPIIKNLLNHRSPTVRWSAAAALGRAKLAVDEIRSRLSSERHELVICELCEALGEQRDVGSASRLRALLRSSKSSLVRSYAAAALAAVLGTAATGDLVKALHHERSRRVIASLNLALFSVGVENALPAILKGLESRDYIIRCRIGNAFTYLRPRRHRGSLLAAVERALAAEKTVAAGEALERAARALVTSPSPKVGSSPPRGAARKRTSIR
jgi:HEAT repeat protein